MSPLSTRLVWASSVAQHQADGKAVLVPLERSDGHLEHNIIILEGVALRIWQLCAQPIALERVRDRLVMEYDAPADVIERDLLRFVAELRAVPALVEV